LTYEIVSTRKVKDAQKIQNPEGILALLQKYRNKKQEYFIVVTLDVSRKPVRVCIVSIGTIDKTVVHPREIFCHAVKDLAKAVIICHNHPSGNAVPSPEDKEITGRICGAGEILGIPVLDHIIICKDDYYSFRKSGFIDENGKYTGE
jgi:DNA repair protein RadC